MLQQPKKLTPASSAFLTYCANRDEANSALRQWRDADPSYSARFVRLRKRFGRTFGMSNVSINLNVAMGLLTQVPGLIHGEITFGKADAQQEAESDGHHTITKELAVINQVKDLQDQIASLKPDRKGNAYLRYFRDLQNQPNANSRPFDAAGLVQQNICVIDSGIFLRNRNDRTDLILSDSPPVIEEGDQVRLAIEATGPAEEQVAALLQRYYGWHPFCRILGSVTTLGAVRAKVRPIMFSFATPQLGLVGQPDVFFDENDWNELRRAHEETYDRALRQVLLDNGVDALTAMKKLRGNEGFFGMRWSLRKNDVTNHLNVDTAKAAAKELYSYERRWHDNLYSFIVWTAFYCRVLRSERQRKFADRLREAMLGRMKEVVVDPEVLSIVAKHSPLRFPQGVRTLVGLYK